MITIREIAELAGVSRGTVDRVLNGRGGVKDSVVERINRIVAEHGYRPNKAARALASHRKSHLIGVISPSVDNMFFKAVLRGIRAAEREVADLNVKLMYREILRFSVTDQLLCIEEMLHSGIDALAINPVNERVVVDKLRELGERGIPVITFNSDVQDTGRLAYIGCDYDQSGRIAAGLLGRICPDGAAVAIVTGSLTSLGHSQRVNGFRQAATAYPGLRVRTVIEMYDDEITSYSKVKELLDGATEIDAFFFSAGGKEGGVRAIRETGSDKRVKVVTVDIDPPTVEFLNSGVVSATICQQPYVQGYEAVRQLAMYVLYSEKPEEEIQYTRSEILIRESLDPSIVD